VLRLWAVLRAFDAAQRAAFLKFVTSCSRPPLLGFASLSPRLCVAMAGGVLDAAAAERLPTASTCANLLKLPPYGSERLMRDKLLYAVGAGAGFDLS
jgi:ubiquitin-protein ligase E3 C